MNFYDQVLLRLEWGFQLRPLGQDPLTEGYSPSRFHISLNIEDKLPGEIERIIREMQEERIQREAWNLVDEELARDNSVLKKKLYGYIYLAESLHNQGRLKESKEMYEIVANMSKSLYNQAEKYVRECRIHEEDLEKKSEAAVLAYKDGKLSESKKAWEAVVKESVPRPLSFEF